MRKTVDGKQSFDIVLGRSILAKISHLNSWIRHSVLCAVILAGANQSAIAQRKPPLGIEVVEIPLVAWVASRAHALPDTLGDFATEDARRNQFRALIEALVRGNWTEAISMAAPPLSYQLAAVQHDDSWFVVASDNTNTGRDPTVIINLAASREVILQAPHMPFERGTGEQAAMLLSSLGGRAAIVSGAHRCASKTFTACDGKTAVCGSLEGYRDSDPSHNARTLFHTAHLATANEWPDAIIISLHGMRDDDDGVRTSVIISSGDRGEDSSAQTVATKLRMGLAALGQPGMVVSCNLPSDDKFDYRKLCGFTNVQGRHINGSPDVCRASVDQGTGRFVHIEQDWNILRPYARSWSIIKTHAANTAMIRVLGEVVPAIKVH